VSFRPFALSVARIGERTRGATMDDRGSEERGSRGDASGIPFDFGLAAYAQGEEGKYSPAKPGVFSR